MDLDGDLEVDLEVDSEGDLDEVQNMLKFNSLELDSLEGRLVYVFNF